MSPRVWFITGSTTGFGAEFVKNVLKRGDKVIATARNESKISFLKAAGAATLQFDVTAPQSELNAKAHEAIGIYGGVDVVVNK
jgi:NAD(P)-dependent dehydrogenase (short-subunit alcohol dehydrogenase family)